MYHSFVTTSFAISKDKCKNDDACLRFFSDVTMGFSLFQALCQWGRLKKR